MSKKYIGIGVGSYPSSIYGDERYEAMKKNGYDFGDLGLSESNHPIYTCDESEIENTIDREYEMAKKAGIKFSQVHGPWRYPPKDFTEEDREERLVKMQKCIRAAKHIGCNNVVIHPLMPFGVEENPDPEHTLKINVEFFKKLLETAEKYEINICIENVPFKGFNLSTPAQVLELVKKLNSPYAKVCLDTGHSSIMGVKPSDAVRELGSYLQVFHIHDNDGMFDQHRFPFEGFVDWEDFTSAIKETGCEAVMSFETAPSRKLDKEAFIVMNNGLALIGKQLAKMAE